MSSSGSENRTLHATVLVACSAMLVCGSLLSVEDDRLELSGAEVPSVCWVQGATPEGCPGCGLTRSVAAFCHLDWTASLRYHPAGVPIGLLLLLQLPYRSTRLAGKRGWAWVPGVNRYVMVFVLILSVVHWLGRVC